MKTANQEALELVQLLPDDVSTDAVLAEVDMLASIRRGLEDVERGNVITQDEARLRLNKWLESSGREKRTGT